MTTTKEKATIDYDKYANMDTLQLATALMNAQKREQRFRAESQAKIKNMRKLIHFLKSKIKESVDKPQFMPYEKSGLPELAREIEKQFTPQEIEQMRQEVKKDMMMSYENARCKK